jgi:coenzyme F420-dependent glucose-6-phosphate dehydrogenase
LESSAVGSQTRSVIVRSLHYGVVAEECGFDSVFVSDHLQPWRHDGGHAPFAMSWLAALGAKTERIVMGTSVLTPTFRYHPGIVAQAFATLGCLYPDRVVLGLGTGESLNEVALASNGPSARSGSPASARPSR